MTRNHLSLVAAFAVTVVTVGCGGPRTFDLAQPSAKKTIERAPDWMLEPPAMDDALVAAATSTSRDMQMALDKARNTAQVDLAQQLGVRMSNLSKQFQEEVGLAADSEYLTQFATATKAVTDETLVGASVAKREVYPEGNVYRAYVLMTVPIGRANQLLMQKLQASNALYTRFRATEAYRELDAAIQQQQSEADAAVGAMH